MLGFLGGEKYVSIRLRKVLNVKFKNFNYFVWDVEVNGIVRDD